MVQTKNGYPSNRYFFLLLLPITCLVSCQGQRKNTTPLAIKPVVTSNLTDSSENFDGREALLFRPNLNPDTTEQISAYVRRIFQDKRGHLWFGSNGFGVSRYDGKSHRYFTTKHGLAGNQVTGIMEDKAGNLWLSTNGGVSTYDGNKMRSFTKNDGLSANWVWSIFQDSKGTIWAGTIGGLCRFDGTKFEHFSLPHPTLSDPGSRFSPNLVNCIMEDKKGNLWFGTDGLGICIYDGKSFTHLTSEDGLPGDMVCTILEAQDGAIWISSMFGGLGRYDGQSFTNYSTANVIGNNEVGRP